MFTLSDGRFSSKGYSSNSGNVYSDTDKSKSGYVQEFGDATPVTASSEGGSGLIFNISISHSISSESGFAFCILSVSICVLFSSSGTTTSTSVCVSDSLSEMIAVDSSGASAWPSTAISPISFSVVSAACTVTGCKVSPAHIVSANTLTKNFLLILSHLSHKKTFSSVTINIKVELKEKILTFG